MDRRVIIRLGIVLIIVASLFLLQWLTPGFGHYWRLFFAAVMLLFPVLAGVALGSALVTSPAIPYRLALSYILIFGLFFWWPSSFLVSSVEQYAQWLPSFFVKHPGMAPMIIFVLSLPIGYAGARIMRWHREDGK